MLTNAIKKELRGHIEPRDPGEITPTGMHKVADGTLVINRSSAAGARTASPDEIAEANTRMAELEQLRQQEAAAAKPKARKSKKAAKVVVEEPEETTVNATLTVEGFGGIPSEYDQVCIGNDMALLGLTAKSFVPQPASIVDGMPSQIIRLSVAPDRRYAYLGSQVVDKRGITNLILVEMKG